MSRTSDFLGDSPLRVLVKLLIVSFLVGIVMSAFGWGPYDIYYGIRDFIVDVWRLGFNSLNRFGNYLLLGASVVIPVFILLRIFNRR